jgi:hypothetical protein
MAFTATAIIEVRPSGSDTANGGIFDPGATMAGDLSATNANTSSPVVTSASYNFVAGDVGAWLFVKAGTNWTPGWYQIASVASNAATLSASAGSAVLYSNSLPASLGTAAGCATTASPTSGTWSVDYSRQDSAQFSFADLAIDATTNTKFTSAAHPVGPNFAGNSVSVTSGTGFTVQRVVINSVSGTTATCDKSLGTLSSTGGNGGLGGGLASPGQAEGLAVSSNVVFYLAGGTYSIGSGTANTAGNRVNGSNGGYRVGYNTTRTIGNSDATLGVVDAGAASIAMFSLSGGSTVLRNLSFTNSAARSSVAAVSMTGGQSLCQRIRASAMSSTAITVSGTSTSAYDCYVTGQTSGSAIATGGSSGQNVIYRCVVNGGSSTSDAISLSTAFNGGYAIECLVINPAGNGILVATNSPGFVLNCTVYGYASAKTGISLTQYVTAFNCLCVGSGSGSKGFSSTSAFSRIIGCAGYNTGGVNYDTSIGEVTNFLTLSGDPASNPGGGDYSPNSTAGAGASIRGVSFTYPGLPTTTRRDIGASQHADPAAGGSGVPPIQSNSWSFIG